MSDYQEKAQRALAAAREVLSKADAEGRPMTSEETLVYNRAMEEFDAIDATIKAQTRLASANAAVVRPESREVRRETANAAISQPGLGSDEYREAFGAYLRGEIRADLKVGTTTSGGYLVPTQFEKTLVQALNENSIMRQLATVFQTDSGSTLYIPSVTTHGSAAYIAEEGTFTTSDETFGQASLAAYKLATAIKVTEELLNDSAFGLEAYLAKEFGRRFGAAEETAFFTGGGSASNQPTGIITSVTVGHTASDTDSITAAELIDLYHSLSRPYRANAVFIANDATIKAIRKLADSNGQFIWQPGLQAGEPDRILSKPVYASSNMPTIATGKHVMLFGDMRGFWIRDTGGTSMQVLRELYSMNGHVGFRGFRRNDAKLIDTSAVRSLKTA